MRAAIALLSLALIATPAKGDGLRLMPPKEYDHPFRGPGELIVTYAKSQGEVRDQCPGAVWPRAGAFGCSRNKSWGCQVVIAPEADAKRVGLTTDVLLRHEIAHCNGWPSDHRGASPIEDWATDATDAPGKNKLLQPSTPLQPASRPCGLAIQKPCD